MNTTKHTFDLKAFGKEIMMRREDRGDTRIVAAEKLEISPRYLQSIELYGQRPSFTVFCSLVEEYNIAVDKYFHSENVKSKSTQRLVVDDLLNQMNDRDLVIIENTTKGILIASDDKP